MIDDYLARLSAELRRRGVTGRRPLDEIREHLRDSVEAAERRGLSHDAAVVEAVERMGDPAPIARQLAASHFRVANAVALAAALALGLAIAYVDSRPRWDDAGITAAAMCAAAFLVGVFAPRRPWLWALAVGSWIPLHAIVRTGNPRAVVMFVVLLFPLAGAYVGAFFGHAVRHPFEGNHVHPS